MERMVNRRLNHFLRHNSLLDSRQHAFRTGHGTGTYFAALGEILKKAKDNNLHAEIVSVDIQKAYNRAYTPIAVQQLISWGLSGNILHFINNFLTERTFQVLVGNTRSAVRCEETGVPQGSVLAVTLFLIIMNTVFLQLPKNIYILAYADDVLLICLGKTLPALRRKVQTAVRAVERWATRSGFRLAPEKSEYIHYCSGNHKSISKPITLYNRPIKLRRTMRVLGVVLDSKLCFTPHFTSTKQSCRTRLNLLKAISGRRTNGNRKVRSKVAKAILDSRLTYGLELTCSAVENMIKILGPTYNTSRRIVSNLLPSTPTLAVHAELGTLPFDLLIYSVIAKRATSYAAKSSSSESGVHLLIEGAESWKRIASRALPPVSRIHWTGDRGWWFTPPLTDKTLTSYDRKNQNPALIQQAARDLINDKYKKYTKRFTDGSKESGKVGFGVHEHEIDHFYRLPDCSSVFSAEAAGVFLASTTPARDPIAVLTDSLSVIQALESPNPQHPWIQAILKYAKPDCVFVWVPGHYGIPGNVSADRLAALGRRGSLYTKQAPAMDIRKAIDRGVREKWEELWLQNRTLCLRKIKDTTEEWPDRKNWRERVVLSRVRTGHTRITHDLSGEGAFRRWCNICRMERTIEHIICVCPEFCNQRSQHGISNSLKEALSADAAAETTILDFLKNCNLYSSI